MPEHIVVTFSWADKTIMIKLAAHLDPQTVATADPSVLDDTIKTISQLSEIELGVKLHETLKKLITP